MVSIARVNVKKILNYCEVFIMEKQRCKWCNLKNPVYVEYHDHEWGIPTYDDAKLFELLILEPFQAGLSWETILNKRESFRRAFAGFDAGVIAQFGEDEIQKMLADASLIRNRAKIEAAINNAGIYLAIQREWGSFSAYIWHFSEGKVICENDRTSSPLSDAVAKDLKKRGMKFIGTTTAYAYLQAIGVIDSHDDGCFMHRLVKAKENMG